MSFLNRWFGNDNEGAASKIYTTLDLWRDVFDGSPGVVTPTTSLKSVTIMRCVTLMSGLYASFPVHVYRKAQNKRMLVTDHPVERLFNLEVASDMDSYRFKQTMLANLLVSGNACAFKTLDSKGRVIGLTPIQHDAITGKWEGEGENRRFVYKVGNKDYSRADIFHVALMSLDGGWGLSPISQVAARLSGHIQAENHQSTVYGNKPMPGMVIQFPGNVSAAQVDALRDSVTKGFTGQSAAKPMILGGGPTVQFPTIPLTDLQYLETLQYGEEQIARLYGIPPYVLGILSKTSSWGTGIEQQNIGFVQYTWIPLVTLFESAIRHQLFTSADRIDGLYVRHNLSSMLRGDMKSQAETLTAYVQGGILTPNQVLAKLDEDPYDGDGGDDHYMQAQMTPVEKLGQTATAPVSPVAQPDATPAKDAKPVTVNVINTPKQTKRVAVAKRDENGRLTGMEVTEYGS
jgi:HK97 family phage portal protein